MTRIAPIPVRQWPPEMAAAISAMTPPKPLHLRLTKTNRPNAANTMGTFAYHPELARAFLTFNGHVLTATTLTERQREMLVLRVATLRGSSYEWAQHLFLARDAGLDDEDIARISWGPDAPFWSELEAALLRAVDELVGDGAITRSTWATLAGEFNKQQLLDVIFTVGAYETLAWMLRSVEVDLEDDVEELRSATKYPPRPVEGDELDVYVIGVPSGGWT